MFHSAHPPFLVPTLNQKCLFVGHMNQGPTIRRSNTGLFSPWGLASPTAHRVAGEPGLA